MLERWMYRGTGKGAEAGGRMGCNSSIDDILKGSTDVEAVKDVEDEGKD